jgi:hypothetical protein
VGKVQSRLFADHGLGSAQALPPLIPVCFLSSEAKAVGLAAKLSRSAPGPCNLRVTRACWAGDCLYLAVDSAGAWQAAQAIARQAGLGEAAAEVASGPFPCVEGFFLGCAEASPEQRSSITIAVPDLRFTSCSIALVRIDCLPDGQSGWRELYWEILEERPLRWRKS